MRNKIFFICLALLLPSCIIAQSPEWQPIVVVRTEYGDDKDKFCYEGVVEDHPPSDQAISCFYVGSEGIFIVDRYQHNIKVFDLAGAYQKTIPLLWRWQHVHNRDSFPVHAGGVDIVVTNGVIYLLSMLTMHPYKDVTKYSMFTFDLETGKPIDRIMIHNPTLGTDLDGREVGNTVRINEDTEGTLAVYDRIRKMSYPLIRNGEVVPVDDQAEGIPGRKFGSRRVRYNPEAGSVKMLDNSGMRMNCDCKGSPRAINRDGMYILTAVNNQKSDEYIIDRMIYDDNCQEIGRIAVLIESRRGWPAFSPNDVFRFGPYGGLYEIHVGNDAVYVYKWSH